MKAVILAAGQGTRMRALGPSKPMVSVEGTALLEMVIKNAIVGGVSEVVVVTGYNGAPLQEFVSNLKTRIRIDIRCVINEDWYLGNGRSVLAARGHIGEPFHILMADHLIDPELLNVVSSEPLPSGSARLAVDMRMQNPHVDIDDVTKVLCKDDKIIEIGKTISAFNAFDTGVFWCSAAIFDAIEQSISEHGDDSLTGGVRALAESNRMMCCDIGDRTWIDVDTPALLSLAQKALVGRTAVAV
jgi:1L-myo-inositol 1-phosphate cytidylyltransferase